MARRVTLGAHVPPVVAIWLHRRIDDATTSDAVRHFREIGRPDVADAIDRCMAEIREAAQQWREARRASADGSAEVAPAETAPRSESVLLHTTAAAGLLGVTPRRVRQLLGDGSLAGNQTAGRWLVPREAIDEYINRRELSA